MKYSIIFILIAVLSVFLFTACDKDNKTPVTDTQPVISQSNTEAPTEVPTETVSETVPTSETDKPTETVSETVPVSETDKPTETVSETVPVSETDKPTETVSETVPVSETDKPTETTTTEPEPKPVEPESYPDGISVVDVTGLARGEKFNIVIGLGKDSMLCGARFDIVYDSAVMSPLTDEEGYILYTVGDPEKVTKITVSQYDTGKLRVVYIGNENLTADGCFLRIEFEIGNEAATGEYTVALEKVDGFYSKDYTELALNIKNSKVSVK